MGTMGRVAAFPLHAHGEMEIREYPVPDPAPGEVLVKVRRANVCGSDLHFWRADIDLSMLMKEPTVLGHEMFGSVAALGSGVATDSAGRPLAEGDRVVYRYFSPCGRCSACLRGFTSACGKNALFQLRACTAPPHFVGAFADYYLLPAGQAVFTVPDALDDETVSSVNCAVAEIVEGLTRAQVGVGDCVVVQGAGGLGLYSTALARFMGADKVIVIDAVPERLALAKEFGAHEVISIGDYADAGARAARVRELNDGNGADVAVEVAGFPDAFAEGIGLLGQGGRYVEIGNISYSLSTQFHPAAITLGNKTVLGVAFYEAVTLDRALRFLDATKDTVPYTKLGATVYPLEKINDAFADSDARRVPRAGIIP